MISSRNKRLLTYAVTHPRMIPAMWRFGNGFKKAKEIFHSFNDNRAESPVVIVVRPTYRCNSICIMCNLGLDYGTKLEEIKNKPEYQELTTDQWKALIEEVAPFKPHIHFSGGEPTLRSDIFELIKFSVSKNLFTSINTNALLLDRKVEQLIDTGIHYIFVSLEGPKEVHEQIRKFKDGSFDRTVSGIRSAVEYRSKRRKALPIIQVQSVIMKENQHHLFETAQLVNNLGVDIFGLFLLDFEIDAPDELVSINSNSLSNPVAPWKRHFKESSSIDSAAIERQIKDIKNTRWNFTFRTYPQHSEEQFILSDYYERPDRLAGQSCHVPWAFADIQPNGNVNVCSIISASVGNITESSFLKIWNGEKYKDYRGKVRDGRSEECLRCARQRTF